ncbi:MULTISPECIES: universal stress protein [unclassified Croceitalea]|uniref:universal stress protein n=1 Tax=unclassified Croceitalea TaxID=2632280 RepID=UPI0030D945A6
MKTILIPTDFSENSWSALQYAIRFFKDVSCNFYILHVGHIRQSSIKGNSFTFPTGELDLPIKEKLDGLFDKIKGLPHYTHHNFIALQEYGNLVNTIRKVVDKKKIDLIVMGTKGASGIKEAIVGSNTGDVITKIQCDVLVVPENTTTFSIKEITFSTDYNIFYNNTILESLAEILNITQSHLNVLNVSRPNTHLSTLQEENKKFLFDYLSETFPNKVTFHTLSNTSSVSMAIQNSLAHNNVDMIIMVAKNLNFLQQLLFDTTIEKLSFHTTVPLLVLHE